MATFVLVHGAFVGGWSWRWVAPYLRGAGHDVYSPTLTGHGERVHLASPQIDLDTHIEDVVNLLHYEDLTGVVLVGYSYGGMVVAGVADRVPERIAHVVYLDSDVPRDGDTSGPRRAEHAAREELARAHGDGWRVPPADAGVETLLEEFPEEQRRWIAARLTPQLLKTWTQPIRLSGRPPRSRRPTSAARSATTPTTRTPSARTRASAASRDGATGSWPHPTWPG